MDLVQMKILVRHPLKSVSLPHESDDGHHLFSGGHGDDGHHDVGNDFKNFISKWD